MTDSLRDWIRDLGRYGSLGWVRAFERRFGDGVDYQSERYRELGEEAVERIHPRRMHVVVKEIVAETPSTKTIKLHRTDGPLPPYRPGQYVNLFLKIGEVWTSRPYSMTSPPGHSTLDLTVREVADGFVSRHLCRDLLLGDTFETTGPAGHFHYEPLIDGSDLVYIAGGSGITPFIAMLRDQERRGSTSRRVQLLYGSRDREDVIFAAELERLAEALPAFSWDLVISEPPEGHRGLTGLIDGELLERRIDHPADKMFYVCGPQPMYELVSRSLKELGVPHHRIRIESFGAPADITTEPGWPAGVEGGDRFTITVEGQGDIEATAGEPLLNSLERSGVVIPVQCRSGQCAACQTEVVDGEFFMLPAAWVRESSPRHRTIHACVTYPLGDMKIRVSRSR